METGIKGKDIIRRYEGCELKAYKCPAGVWTIGYGHTKGVKSGDEISKTKAEIFLAQDLKEIDEYLNRTVPYLLNQDEHDALASFVYNLGQGNLNKSTLLLKLKAGRPKEEVAEEFRKWCYAGGRVLPGLVRRREAERSLFLGLWGG